ncbi:ATP-binding cassette, subfamily G (WHITE), member 2, PDR [Marchantia polymorpha subsp. ruderalis]
MAAPTGMESLPSVGRGRRSGSMRDWVRPDDAFAIASQARRGDDETDEEALQWAALEKLSTYDRMRTTIFENLKGSKKELLQLELKDMSRAQNQYLIQKLFQMNPEEDNEKFLAKLRSRIDRVSIDLPKVEVRYENLTVDADVQVGTRALPTLTNTMLSIAEMILETLRIMRRKKTKLEILENVSGILKPGRMTLLLGPPGSGKTTLLLALAGQLDTKLRTSGTITYNGHTLSEFKPRKTAAYISQTDLHSPELTVRETLQYSARFQGIGSRYELLTELVKREKELGIHPEPDVDAFMKGVSTSEVSYDLVTEYIMKILGLDICADTLVGDQIVRGISGGQKKRVTTGEMLVGPMKTLFMDEISTGLDSSTTYQIIKCLGQFAHVIESTIFISLLQPAPETYELFDDLVLISDGKLVYHGPRDSVLEFLETCGFRCPERKGVADFLQEVTSRKDQEQYWIDKSKPYRFVTVGEFSEAYKRFHVGQAMAEELKIPYDKSKSHKAALIFSQWSMPKWDLLKVMFDREVTLLKRSSFIYIFKSSQLALQALIATSAFFRTRMHHRTVNDAQIMSGALFFSIVSVMFNGFAETTMIVTRLPVFYKQRSMRFFPAWTFSVSTFILRLPFAVIETSVWVCIVYYTIGMAPNVGRFFRQLVFVIFAHIMASSMFRMIAGLTQTLVIANSLGSLTLLLVFVLGGFVLPRTSIKDWWIWGYYISPLSYALNGVAVNEFLAPQWRKPSGIPGDNHTLGRKYLKNAGLFARGYWYYLAAGVMIIDSLIFTAVFTWAITYLRAPGSRSVGMSPETLAEREANRTGKSLHIESLSKRPTLLPIKVVKSMIPRSLNGNTGSKNKSHTSTEITSEDGGNESSRSGAGEVQLSQQPSSNEASTSASGEIVPSSKVVSKKGMVLPFQPYAISFSGVNYYVDMPPAMREATGEESGSKLQLLQDITGAFRPGVLTALMGVTGAGKSTLMDVLAGRKTKGIIEGDIRISGFAKKHETFARIAGYCEQNDIHSPQVTVKESLIFSAWLRLSRDVEPDTKMQFVQEVMDLVELATLKDALVGLPGQSGLSTEQRKRLTIAVELVANPSIIFMDEPTSGLDARAAAIVMRTVRNTVDTGRTVVCTIHQPSIDNFEAFDELLLLKRGGQVVYAGPLGRNSCSLVEYFEAIPGVPKIKDGYNPAAWMLEVTSQGTENKLNVNFFEIYKNSALFERNKALVSELSTPAPNTEDIYFSEKFSQPFLVQLKYCLLKKHWTYWRSPDYNILRFALAFFSALFFGSMFWRVGHHTNSQASLFSIMGSIYASQLFIGVQFSSSVQPLVATERTVFYREKTAGMYSEIPYALAQMMIEVPYIFATASMYALITYAMMNLQWQADKFFWYLYFLFMTQLYFTFYGITAVALSPNSLIAAVVSGFFYNIWNLFAGFIIPKPKLPVWWRWFYWVNPIAYTLYGCIASQFGDMDDKYVISAEGDRSTVKQFVEHHFGFKHSFLPFISLMMLGFVAMFAVITIFAMKFLNYQSR